MITVKKATREDAQAAFEIRKSSILDKCVGYYSEEQLTLWTKGLVSEKFMDTVENRFYIATVDDVVGATGMVDTENGMVDAIFVDPKYMGLGLAKKIMSHLEQLAKDSGLNVLKLDSTLNAASFYRSLGFNGDEVSTYESPGGISLDCIPMKKDLVNFQQEIEKRRKNMRFN